MRYRNIQLILQCFSSPYIYVEVLSFFALGKLVSPIYAPLLLKGLDAPITHLVKYYYYDLMLLSNSSS